MSDTGPELPNAGPLVEGYRIQFRADVSAGRVPIEHGTRPARVVKRILDGSETEVVQIGTDFQFPRGDQIEAGADVLHVLPTELIDHAVVAVIAGIKLVEGIAVEIFRRPVARGVIIFDADARLPRSFAHGPTQQGRSGPG